MAEWLPLSEVVSRPGLEARPVAWRAGQLIERGRFLADVRAWQAAFSSQPGPRVALYFDDSYDFACALFGAWHAGKEVCLPGDSQPATLQRLLPDVGACGGELPGALRPLPGTPSAGVGLALDPQHTRLVVYTSGSSGEPLAIAKRLAQLDAELRTLQAAFGTHLDDPSGPASVYATVSHQHIYGLLFHILWPLAAGRPFVAERLVYPEEMAALLGRRRSWLVTSPAHLKRLPASLDWQGVGAGLQAVFSSGGPLPAEAADSAQALLGHSPVEVFGSSETGGVAWRQRARHGDHWTALPGVDWRIEGDLLAVRSPHLADEGWFLTADRVQAGSGGDFVLLGRADRVVKIEEKRVSITAMERALCRGGELADARVVVLPTEAGVRLAVVGVPGAAGLALLRNGKRQLNERLRAALLDTVERVALPRRFRYVAALPVNAQGKVTEAGLLSLFRPVMPQVVWHEQSEARAEAELDIGADLLAFDGHFPEAPLLPGVVQLDWAIHFGRSCFASMPRQFLRASNLKFQRPVLPGMRLRLQLSWDAAGGALAFVYSSSGGRHASGSLLFGVPDAAG